MDSTAFLSVVTVHYQDFFRLRLTLESLLPRLADGKVEWVVIDGGSKLENEEEHQLMSRVESTADTYLSERDDGIYDAMNKGMKLAKGEYVLFLNSGDQLWPDFSLPSLRATIRDARPDMIWGQVQFEYPDGSFGVRKLRGPNWLVYGMPICHQSVLFLRRKFLEMEYNIRYEIAADYELLVRAVKSKMEVLLVQDVISKYATGGVSQTERKTALDEESQIRVEYFGFPRVFSTALSLLKAALWKFSDFSPALNRIWRKRI